MERAFVGLTDENPVYARICCRGRLTAGVKAHEVNNAEAIPSKFFAWPEYPELSSECAKTAVSSRRRDVTL